MMNDKYDFHISEKKLQDKWENIGVYNYDENVDRVNTFSIDTPPPTVSGSLHIGHVYSFTQTDFIARYQRMSGKNVFYPMGFDDNGLPTERLVEKTQNIRAKDMSREKFRALCMEVVKSFELEFKALFKSLALSVDWRQEYQTISSKSRTLSQMSFIDLYNKGYIKRDLYPTYWDVADHTAIAQTEIEDKEKEGLMNEIIFHLKSGEEIIIATTRPEMIPACVAIFYHPDDPRYNKLKDNIAITPLMNKEVRLLPDEDVDMEKGTGLVMCCTFGDIQDVQWWKKHKLETISCINLNGIMENAGEISGLKVKEGRVKILEILKDKGLIKSQTEIKQIVKCAERSGCILELIITNQWYIKVMEYKEALIKKACECKWYPEYMRIRLENWINGLNQEWCISRQRYFGVPFPVWYSKRKGEEGKVLLPDLSQLPVDPLIDLPKGYTRDEVEGEKDIMDTWATSALTPQLSSGGIASGYMLDEDRHKKLFPFDLRPQAHEIIRVWAFGSIVKSMMHENTIPWKNLMISGWCLAADRGKMSKSKGNGVVPGDLIATYGADIVRYWASSAGLGTDIVYSEEVLKIGKKLANKLWNASRFCATHIEKIKKSDIILTNAATSVKNGEIFCVIDLWILSELRNLVQDVTSAFEVFDYRSARSYVEDFFWKNFCDNYLELVKKRVYDSSADKTREAHSAMFTMYYCLQTILKLLAPFIPHITDEIYNQIYDDTASIHAKGNWPKDDDQYYSEAAIKNGRDAVKFIELIRKFKSERSIALNAEVQSIVLMSKYGVDNGILDDIKNTSNSLQISNKNLFGGYQSIASDCEEYVVKVKL